MIREALDKMEKISTHGFKGLLRLRGLNQRKAGKRFVLQIALYQILRKSLKELLMLPLEIDQKSMDALCKDSDPAKSTHIGFDMHRVNALRRGVHIENPGEHLGTALKENLIQMILDHQIAHAPQGLRTKVLGLIGFLHNVQSVMPLKVEGQLRDRLFIGQIMDLLEKQDPQSGVEFLGGSSKRFIEEGGDFIHGKFAQNMFPEKSSPRGVHEFTSLLTKEVPWIEKVGGFVISGVNHLSAL
jgi:hypothetical protein